MIFNPLAHRLELSQCGRYLVAPHLGAPEAASWCAWRRELPQSTPIGVFASAVDARRACERDQARQAAAV